MRRIAKSLIKLAHFLDKNGSYALSDVMGKEAGLYESLSADNVIWRGNFEDSSVENATLPALSKFLYDDMPTIIQQELANVLTSEDAANLMTNLEYFFQKIFNKLDGSTFAPNANLPVIFELALRLLNTRNQLKQDWGEDCDEKDPSYVLKPPAYSHTRDVLSNMLGSYCSRARLSALVRDGTFDLAVPFLFQIARGKDIDPNVADDAASRQELMVELQERHPGVLEIFADPESLRAFIIDLEDDKLKNKFGYPVGPTYMGNNNYDPTLETIRSATRNFGSKREYADITCDILENKDIAPTSYMSAPDYDGELSLVLLETMLNRRLLEKSGALQPIPEGGLHSVVENLFRELIRQREYSPSQTKELVDILGPRLPQVQQWIRDSAEAYTRHPNLSAYPFQELYDGQVLSSIRNGLLSASETEDFLRRNPYEIENFQAPWLLEPDTIRDIEEANRRRKQAIAETQKPYFEEAVNKYIVSFAPLSNDAKGLEMAKEEGARLGMSADDVVKYANRVIVYKVELRSWVKFLSERGLPEDTFLGEKLDNRGGLFSGEAVDHTGRVGPMIVIFNDYYLPSQLENLFKNLKLQSSDFGDMTNAHERAHWLHYLRTGYAEYSPEVLQDDERLTTPQAGVPYITFPRESVAYAHGTLPYFYSLVRGHINEIMGTKQVQEAVKDWYVDMIMNAEAGRLEGIDDMRSIQILAEKLYREQGIERAETMGRVLFEQTERIFNILAEEQAEEAPHRIRQMIDRIEEIKGNIRYYTMGDSPEDKIYHNKLQEEEGDLKTKIKILRSGQLDFDLDDAAQALAIGFIRQYFIQIAAHPFDSLPKDQLPEIHEYANYIIDSTFGGTSNLYRPLTSEHMPIFDSPASGFGLHENVAPAPSKESSIIHKMQKFANKMDLERQYEMADKMDQTWCRSSVGVRGVPERR